MQTFFGLARRFWTQPSNSSVQRFLVSMGGGSGGGSITTARQRCLSSLPPHSTSSSGGSSGSTTTRDAGLSAFAVEGPDGHPDIVDVEEYTTVQHMMDTGANLHDSVFWNALRAQQQQQKDTEMNQDTVYPNIFAVDSPDGTCDEVLQAECNLVQEIIDHVAEHEDKEEILRIHQENEDLKATLSSTLPNIPFATTTTTSTTST